MYRPPLPVKQPCPDCAARMEHYSVTRESEPPLADVTEIETIKHSLMTGRGRR